MALTEEQLDAIGRKLAGGWRPVSRRDPLRLVADRPKALSLDEGLALIAEVRRLRGVVQAAEWAAIGQLGEQCCPWCWGLEPWKDCVGGDQWETRGGHVSTCRAFGVSA